MPGDKNNSRNEVSAWYILPVIVAFVPVILAFAMGNHRVGRAIFGGWNLLILIPTFYWVTYLLVERLTEDKRNDG